MGKLTVSEIAKSAKPKAIKSEDITEQTRGPKLSNMTPKRRGPRKLKKFAMTNIICR